MLIKFSALAEVIIHVQFLQWNQLYLTTNYAAPNVSLF